MLSFPYISTASVVALLLYVTSSAFGAIISFQPDQPIEIRRHPPDDPFEQGTSKFVDLDLTGNGQGDLVLGNILLTSDPMIAPRFTIAIFEAAPNDSMRIGSFTNIFGEVFAVPMPAGASIGGSESAITWTGDPAMFFRYEQIIDGGYASDVAIGQLERIRPLQYTDQLFEGPTHQGEQGYFALEFSIDDEVFYGWIEVDTSFDGLIPDGGQITRWAYNPVPGEPIRAGEIPEPATMGLLTGIAALGLTLFIRRRRKR